MPAHEAGDTASPGGCSSSSQGRPPQSVRHSAHRRSRARRRLRALVTAGTREPSPQARRTPAEVRSWSRGSHVRVSGPKPPLGPCRCSRPAAYASPKWGLRCVRSCSATSRDRPSCCSDSVRSTSPYWLVISSSSVRRWPRTAGSERGTEGDSFFVTFPTAAAATLAAVDAQRALEAAPWPQEGVVRVRMGIHVGEIAHTEAGIVGLAVHHAARVAAAGHGAQVVVSGAARVAAGDVPGVRWVELGQPCPATTSARSSCSGWMLPVFGTTFRPCAPSERSARSCPLRRPRWSAGPPRPRMWCGSCRHSGW